MRDSVFQTEQPRRTTVRSYKPRSLRAPSFVASPPPSPPCRPLRWWGRTFSPAFERGMNSERGKDQAQLQISHANYRFIY